MAKSSVEIEAKIQEVFKLVNRSSMPISELSIQTTLLMREDGWTYADIERISGEVMTMLIRHGWKKSGG